MKKTFCKAKIFLSSYKGDSIWLFSVYGKIDRADSSEDIEAKNNGFSTAPAR